MKKRIITLFLALTMVFALTACAQNEKPAETPAPTEPQTEAPATEAPEANVPGGDTMGAQMTGIFLEQIQNTQDLPAIAEAMTADLDMSFMIDEIDSSEEYFPGLTETPGEFSACVRIAPMIGSIPFISYIFQTSDPESFQENLLSKADPRWNICTEAAETVSEISGDYVFFAMCPGEDD